MPNSPVKTQKLVIQTQNTERGIAKNLFLIVIALSIALIIAISSIVMLAAFNKPQDRYFALDNDLKVVQLVPTNEPLLSDEKITRWTNSTINQINTLSFTHWRNQIQASSDKFTDKAFRDFITQLRDSGNLSIITDKRLNTIVMLTGGSVITRKGLEPSTGQYVWYVETPFMINYEGSKGVEATQRLVSTTKITRVSTLETPVGIKITNYVTTLKGN